MKRSKHSLSHYNLLTGKLGQLLPVGLVENLIGDTFQHQQSALIRFQPLSAPVMHPVTTRIHNFNVPLRILWGSEYSDSGTFENFITGGKDGNDDQQVPTITVDHVGEGTTHQGSILDLLGIPPDCDGLEVNALPFRAYFLIFEEYYADQDLYVMPDWRDPAVLKTLVHNPPPHASWQKDYATTSRPWAQKGAEVTLPLGNKAPVTTDFVSSASVGVKRSDTNDNIGFDTAGLSGDPVRYRPAEVPPDERVLYADLSAAGAININDFRKAFALQRYKEARARYGSRFVEYLQYLGVRPSDQRLQRPEYLSGSKQTVQFSEVLQTAPNENLQPGDLFGVGDLYGHGIAAMRSNRYRKFFEEPGYVLSLMSVIPKPMYMNGVARHFLYRDKEDYFQKELSQIGQQMVLSAELYADGTADDLETFGFQDRYAHLKHQMSRVHNEFRTTLNYFHLARDFGNTRPVLNQSFIDCIPNDRIFQIADGDKMMIMVNHSLQARRMVPKSASSRIL